MCTSIVSALTRRPVFHDIAMTGEITLRGRILPIGGLKEKILAAHRAEITHVIMPKENVKEIPELPDRIREDLTLIPVSHLDEVLNIALLEAVGPPISLQDKKSEGSDVIIPPLTNGGADHSIQAERYQP